MNKIIGVYVIRDIRTNKFYVGSSGNVLKRLQGHYANLRRNVHSSSKLLHLWQNGAALIHTIMQTNTREEAYLLEQDIINRYIGSELMLNVGKSVKGGDNLTYNENREDIIRRIKETSRKNMAVLTPEDRKLLFSKPGSRNGMYGKKHTPAAKKIMSEVNKGNKYCLGLKRSQEQRLALSEQAKKRVGALNPFFGKKHSEKTRALLSEKNKGTLPPNCKRISVDGIMYSSAAEAARKLNISISLLTYRARSCKKKYSNYIYIS